MYWCLQALVLLSLLLITCWCLQALVLLSLLLLTYWCLLVLVLGIDALQALVLLSRLLITCWCLQDLVLLSFLHITCWCLQVFLLIIDAYKPWSYLVFFLLLVDSYLLMLTSMFLLPFVAHNSAYPDLPHTIVTVSSHPYRHCLCTCVFALPIVAHTQFCILWPFLSRLVCVPPIPYRHWSGAYASAPLPNGGPLLSKPPPTPPSSPTTSRIPLSHLRTTTPPRTLLKRGRLTQKGICSRMLRAIYWAAWH
jgi:hypothetical protein